MEKEGYMRKRWEGKRKKKALNSGAFYYNYKRFFSIVMMAVVNANYEFLYLDMGKNRWHSDGSVKHMEFYRRLQNETHNLPSTT